jgi:Fe-S cluster biogenesis protein NfuA/nitrite reductase/ring-hydroxylating ferredoxin subunit
VAVASGDVGERVEALLAKLHQQGGERAAGTGEELVRLLVEFYGAGLERIVAIVGADRPPLVEALADDPLVESQLILHGLHPIGVDERIERALDRVRPYLGSHAGGVAYLGIDDDGVAHLRLDGSCNGCSSSTVTVKLTIEEALLAAAPELASIEVEGQAEPAKPLLQIGLRPGGPVATPAPTATVWVHPSALELPAEGRAGQVLLDGRPVLMCRVGDTYYAYTDSCPSCGGSLASSGSDGLDRAVLDGHGLDAGVLDGDVLGCGSCGSRYDVRLAGRAVNFAAETAGEMAGQMAGELARGLDPLPLLDDVSGIRVALLPETV